MRISPLKSCLTVAAIGLLASCSDNPAPDTSATPPRTAAKQANGGEGTSLPPWPAPSNVTELVAQAGLDLGPMGTAEHYHPQLRIIVKDKNVPIPANIGVDPATGAMSALHTHEPDGTLHIEADRKGEVFTLGQFFTEWGVRLTRWQIGGVKAATGERVDVISNGKAFTGRPGELRLEPDQTIEISVR